MRIVALDTYDLRFPTSRELDGSDAMNPDPDYPAAYVVLRTDAPDGHEGHGFAFTIGRGNDVQSAAIAALAPYLVGRPLEATLADLGADLADDVRRMRVAREACGPDVRIAVDANQRWDVGPAVEWVRALAEFEPWWVEEPTAPGFSATTRPETLANYSYPDGPIWKA